MRSVRMLLATATATAALAIAPAAYAVTAGDWDQEDSSSHSEEHGKDSGNEHDKDYSKEHGKESKHDEPRGGMHTGGGALALVNSEDDWGGDHDKGSWGGDHEQGKDDSWKGDHEKDDWGGDHDEESWGGGHGKPHGGMHTGGGGLAGNSGVTAGGLAALAVAGTGVYAMRRRQLPRGQPLHPPQEGLRLRRLTRGRTTYPRWPSHVRPPSRRPRALSPSAVSAALPE